MAAAVLAAPEGGSAAMPMGSAATCPPPAGPAGPGSWSRSLDRALEEAAASGTLSLSGRKLRDYPRASAANHDLSDTTRCVWECEIYVKAVLPGIFPESGADGCAVCSAQAAVAACCITSFLNCIY
uniref:Uncharacterized protein n=1 Tax=Gallus gallus TaxID=9031 RepID=A0A8V0YRS7_CHICK